MRFTELAELADKVADRLKEYVSVDINYSNYLSGTKETQYSFYRESSKGSIYFGSAQELKAHMENIVNPVKDEGIDINDKWVWNGTGYIVNDGILRGAE